VRVEDAGDVSPLAATVPLHEEGQGRKTDGLAPGEERASAETSRVSRADVERLLRSQHEDGADRKGPDSEAADEFGRDTLVGVRALADEAIARDPEATLVAHSAVTRPDAPAAFGNGEELTVTVPRPGLPTETREVALDSFAAPDASSNTLRGTTRDAPAFEPDANAPAPHESAPLAPPSPDGHASAETPFVQPHVAPGRRRWPFVVAACVAALLFTVAAAWLAVRFLRRSPVTETASPAPTAAAAVAPDVQQQFDEKLAQAEALLAQGNMDEAVARLREANTLDPSNARAHRRLGELLLASGARREAVEEFRAVTRNAPEDFTAWRQLATAQFAEGLYRDAAESYRRLVALVGDAAEPSDLLSYADALRLSGRTDEARAIYQRLTSAPSSDASDAARQRLAELARAQTLPGAGQHADEQVAAQPREGETASSTSPAAQPTPAQAQPTPAPTPQPTPQPARSAAATPAERYRRGVELWSSNRSAALEEFRAAAAGGNADAHYYLGLGYVEGRGLHALKRAEVVAALQHFQMAQRGGEHAADARRYEQELERVFDRLRKQ
jgi:tetratricopeptide (TPR) repeat protein